MIQTAACAITLLAAACSPSTPSTPDAPTPSPTVPRGEIQTYCLRPDTGDVLFAILPMFADGTLTPESAELRVFRAPIDDSGGLGATEPFVDFPPYYERGQAFVEELYCHPTTGELIVQMANGYRMAGDAAWWSELWRVDRSGAFVGDHALARDIGVQQLAWSPDGRTLLVEASPMAEAGAVYVLDLATEKAVRIEGAGLESPAGSGGGRLHWGGDGRLAILESRVLAADGGLAARLQVVDPAGPTPQVAPDRLLPNVLATALDPSSMLIYVTAAEPHPGLAATVLEVRRWNPATPDADPVALGRVALPATIRLETVNNLWLLPPDDPATAPTRMVLTVVLDDPVPGAEVLTALFLIDVTSPDAPDAWRLAPTGTEIGSAIGPIQVTQQLLAYRRLQSESAPHDLHDLADKLAVIPLTNLAPEQLSANPNMIRIPQR